MITSNTLPTLREEYLKKKRNKKLFYYGVVVFLFIIIFFISAYIARRPELSVSKVELSGGVLVTQQEIESSALQYLEGDYLWFFPIANSLWYPKSGLEKYLKESYGRIDTIDISSKDLTTLQIHITERKPVALWCKKINEIGESGAVSVRDDCYFMDSNSVIFAEAPTFSGDAYFKYYGLVEASDPVGQSYLASSTEFSIISSLVLATQKLSLRPQYLLARGEGEFSIVIFGGAEIYFDLKKPIVNTIENLEALLENDFPKTRENLPVEYIDLRFGNKLFYKLKN